MARRRTQSANSDWNEYKKVDTKRSKGKQTRNTRKQKVQEKRNFIS